jgi:probable rRNA maturation factor
MPMKETQIFFFKEGIKFRLSDQDKLREWISKGVRKEKYSISNINFIFCTDVYLRKINKKYLGHDYFTDIVTFDNSVESKMIEGDIFISIDRIKKNSIAYQTSFRDELHRVLAHGVLHLLGYGDKNISEKAEMKKMEDLWLKLRGF